MIHPHVQNTPTHTLHFAHLKPELMTFDVVLFRKTANMRSQPLFQHSPCAAWYSLNPVLNRHEKPLPSVTHPLFAPWCLWLICSTPASSDPPHTHTHTRHTDTQREATSHCSSLSPSPTEWKKSTLASSFLLDAQWGSCYGDGIQRRLRQPMYTWVGRSLSLCL